MTGTGPSCRERYRGRIYCKEYREEVVPGLLVGHIQTQYGKASEGSCSWEATVHREEPRTYRIAFLIARGTRNCPVKGCPGQAATRTAVRVHFFYRHVRDTVIILEEGNLPRPQCPQCNMLVPWNALNRRHISTAQCAKGAERKRRRLAEEELLETSGSAFRAYGVPLETVTSFKYQGRVMTAEDNS